MGYLVFFIFAILKKKSSKNLAVFQKKRTFATAFQKMLNTTECIKRP